MSKYKTGLDCMSASHSQQIIFRPIPHSNANITTQSLLNFDQIFELLNKGLVNFIACFTENDERATKFKEAFAASLLASPLDRKNFNQFGTLMIKAGYPGIFKLSGNDEDNLKRLGILSISQNASLSISQFFKRDDIEKFVSMEVKKHYKPEVLSLVGAIYGFIETASCSIEYENILTRYDKNNKIIIDKNVQPAVYSAIDLQLGTATNNLKLASEKLVKLKSKTRKADAITQSLEKMRAAITTATSERTNNLAEEKSANLKKESTARKSELDQAKETLQSIQSQLEEERRKAQELAAQKMQLEKLALDRLTAENFSSDEKNAAQLDKASIHDLPSYSDAIRGSTVATGADASPMTGISNTGSHNATGASGSASTVSLFSRNPSELAEHYQADVVRRESDRVREQEHIQLSTEMIIEEAQAATVNLKSLTHTFDHLISKLNTPHSTQASILRSLIQWEKSALAYIESHKSSASISTAVAQRLPGSVVSVLSFIGQRTGMGRMKTVDPLLATALKNQLADIMKQCIIITENDKNFNDCVRGLNQHQRYLAMNHTEAALVQGTVSTQFTAVTLAMTQVAINRFNYVSATSSRHSRPTQ
jgi:hypothetical protein